MNSPVEAVVIDTSLVSYIARKSPLAGYYIPHLEGRRIVISFHTREEVLYGAYLANWGERRVDDLKLQLEQYEVQWPDPALVDMTARLRASRRAAGREMDKADAWIAATALYLDCPLVSHDGDFVGIPGLQLIRDPSPSRRPPS